MLPRGGLGITVHGCLRLMQRYIHFMPKDKRETANSIPFEF